MSLVEMLVHLVPLLVLGAALLLGRYPGERALRRRLENEATGGRVPSPAPPIRRPALTLLPRGGELLGWALAGRAPPCETAGP
jgi:hypothetical protein